MAELEKWAREERRARCAALNVFASLDDVTRETKHFKEQCLLHGLHSLKDSFKDIIKMTPSSDTRVFERKLERFQLCKTECSHLVETLSSAESNVVMRLRAVQGKHGRMEEERWWKNLQRKAEHVKIQVFMEFNIFFYSHLFAFLDR